MMLSLHDGIKQLGLIELAREQLARDHEDRQ